MKNHRIPLAVIAILFVLLAVPRLYFPDLDHGDEFQDADVLNAGSNFITFGFWNCRFLPILEVGQAEPDNAYTHFPPLPMIINGLLRLIFRTDSLVFFRAAALLFSLFHVLAWYAFIFFLFADRRIALISALLYMTNSFFIFGFDALSSINLADGFRAFMLMTFAATLRYEAWRRRLLILLWFLCMIAALISFEYIVYMVLFFALYRFAFRPADRYPSFKLMLFLASAPVAGFLLHLLQNAWYFGSLSEAVSDLTNRAVERAWSGHEISAQNQNLASWVRYVLLNNIRLAFGVNYFLILLSGFAAYLGYQGLPAGQKGVIRDLFRLFLIVFACCITWYVLFPSHSLAHAFIFLFTRHLVPAAALFFTLVFTVFLFVVERPQPSRMVKRAAWALCFFFLLLWGVFTSGLPVTGESMLHSDDFRSFKQCLLALRELSGTKDAIGLNYHRNPFIRYYTGRRCIPVFTPKVLESQKKLPRFFIWFPDQRTQAMALLEVLKQDYEIIYESRSRRFPAVFFRKKQE